MSSVEGSCSSNINVAVISSVNEPQLLQICAGAGSKEVAFLRLASYARHNVGHLLTEPTALLWYHIIP
jgi:hypothetical protein